MAGPVVLYQAGRQAAARTAGLWAHCCSYQSENSGWLCHGVSRLHSKVWHSNFVDFVQFQCDIANMETYTKHTQINCARNS